MGTTQNEIVDAVTSAMAKKDLTKQAVTTVEKSAAAVLTVTQQNIKAGLAEDAEAVVRGLVRTLTERLTLAAHNWYDLATKDLIVYPLGTRFIHRFGTDVQRIIIEQPPQVRTIALAGGDKTPCVGDDWAAGETSKGSGGYKFFRLSMPYCIFMLQFTKGVMDEYWFAGWRQQQLSKMDDIIYNTGMTNINTGGSLCMGSDFKNDQALRTKGKTISEQCDYFISTYWQSIFNSDLNSNWNAFRAGNPQTFSSWKMWQATTERNPLAILSANLTAIGPLKNWVTVANNAAAQNAPATPDIPDLRVQLKTEIAAAVKQLGEQVSNWLAEINVLSDNRPQIHVKTVSDAIREIVIQAYVELWAWCQRRLDTERKELHEEMRRELDKEMASLKKLLWDTAKATDSKKKYSSDDELRRELQQIADYKAKPAKPW